MKFADFFPAAGLAFYAEVALGLFVIAFIAVAANLMAKPAKEMERRCRLPLGDDELTDILADDSAKETH